MANTTVRLEVQLDLEDEYFSGGVPELSDKDKEELAYLVATILNSTRTTTSKQYLAEGGGQGTANVLAIVDAGWTADAEVIEVEVE